MNWNEAPVRTVDECSAMVRPMIRSHCTQVHCYTFTYTHIYMDLPVTLPTEV